MRKLLMALDRVGNNVVARNIDVVLGDEAPATVAEMPVHNREGDDVLETLDVTRDQGATRPGTGVADVEVIAALLGGVLGAGLARDPVAE